MRAYSVLRYASLIGPTGGLTPKDGQTGVRTRTHKWKYVHKHIQTLEQESRRSADGLVAMHITQV